MQIPPEAAGQGGRSSYQQLRAAGWTHHRIRRAVADGVLVVTGYGVYAVAGDQELADPVAEHAAKVVDRQLSSGQSWAAARRSAALLMGLPLIGHPPAVPQLLSELHPVGAHGHDRNGRIGPFPSAHRWVYGGVLMTTPARTVVDIGRQESFRNAVVVADAALRRGLEVAELDDVLRVMRRWPGVARARSAVRFADGRAESPGESVTRVACAKEGVHDLEPQVEVWSHGVFVARVDLLHRESLTAVESDGAMKFTGVGVLPALLSRDEGIRECGVDVVHTWWDETFKDTEAFGCRLRSRIRERGTRPLPRGVELRSTVLRPQAPLLGSFDAAA